MKLLKLEIHNITSITQSTIDFENSIIAREPLFLICGETGAGKSTILNTICMALYNKVPTMPNSNEYYEDRKVGDLSNFLRKGTGEGYIHLLFEEGGVRYEADWMIRRAHNKPSGKLQKIERLLRNLNTDETIATKVDEVNIRIKDIIGLDFERFTRMFMLAQGQFNKFLTADEKEKSNILESLTQMDIYNKTGNYIHNKKIQVETELYQTRQRIEAIHLLTDEEKEERLTQIASTKSDIKNLNIEIAGIETKITWKQSFIEYQSELDDVQNEFEKIGLLMNSEENTRKLHEVQLWDDTVKLRQCLQDIVKQQETNRKHAESVAVYQKDYIRYISLLGRAKQELSLRKQELDRKEEDWNRLRSDEKVYENQQTIVAELGAITQLEKDINEYKEKNESIEKQIIAWKKTLKEIEDKRNSLSDKVLEQKTLCDSKQREIEKSNKEELQQKRNALSIELTDIESAKAKWGTASTAAKALQEAQNKITNLRSECTKLKQEADIAQKKSESAKKIYKVQLETFETKKLTIDECAKLLRKSLKAGEPCPICGSLEHSVQPETILMGLYEQAKQMRDDAEKEKDKAQQQLAIATSNIELKEKELRNTEDTILPQLISSKTNADREWQLFYDKYTPKLSFEDSLQALVEAQQTRAQRIKAIDTNLNGIKELELALQRLQKDLEMFESELQQHKDAYKNQLNSIERAQANIEQNKAVIERNIKTIESKIAILNKLISWQNWKERWAAHKERFEQKLMEENKQYQNCKLDLPILRNAINTIKSNVDSSERSIEAIMTLMPDWKDIEETNAGNIQYKENLAELLSAFVAQIKESINQKRANEQATQQLSSLKIESIEYYEATHVEAKLGEDELLALSLLKSDLINQSRQETDAIKEKYIRAKGIIEQLQESIKRLQEQTNKPTEKETLDSLHEIKKEKDTLKGGKQSLVGSLMQQMNNDTTSSDERTKLLEECNYKKKNYDNWTALDTLFGLDRFSKAAQQISFRFLLEKANQHLRNLYPRYRLQCAPESFALAVEDNEMGTSRPCTTLSGGESFIVSLALALGLSSLSEEKIQIDTLFIDEGFGTLSSDYLDTVMKVLENLHRTGRKVGIISHVEILRERIPAQIQVIRKSRTESEIRVAGV